MNAESCKRPVRVDTGRWWIVPLNKGNNPKTTPPLTGCVILRLLHASPMPIGAACAQWSSGVETNWN